MRSRETDWRTLRIARPSSENSRGPQHRLVPDRDGLEPERAIAVEVLLGRADDRESPAARARDASQLRKQRVDLRLVADGIAADERRARDDAVGEERAAGRREEIALVASQREEREAVAAVAVDERPRDPPLAHRLRDGVAERPQPEVEGEKPRTMPRPRRASPVRGDSSMPRSSAPTATAAIPARAAPRPSSGRTLAGSPGTSKRRRQRTSAASRSSEIVASSKSRPFARCATAEATTTATASCQARRRRLRERAREPDQADPEGDREHARGLRPPRRQNALDDLDAVRHLRRQRRDDADHADDRGSPGEEPLRAGRAQHHAPGYNVSMRELGRARSASGSRCRAG